MIGFNIGTFDAEPSKPSIVTGILSLADELIELFK